MRVIATTHQDLGKLVTYGKFRRDLYHRINRFPIFLPPLRERKEDIPLLAAHFLEKFKQELGKPLPGISKAAINELLKHPWPGNVRELKNLIERAAIITDDDLIRPDHLSTDTRKVRRADTDSVHLDIRISSDEFSLDAATQQIKDIILKRCNGNKSKAAEMLKVNRKRFYR
jgi:DNA-binding NtrC family response regulator